MKKIMTAFLFFTIMLSTEAQAFAENGKAIDFELNTIDGHSKKLSDYKGKIVILNFWTSWCEYCYEEMMELNALYHEADKTEVELLAINITSQERNEEDVRHFVRVNKMTFPVLLDKKGEVMKKYRILGIPTTIIIDEEGMIKKTMFGPVTKKVIEEEIKK
ncbi:TlpA disulfide reductase family protein [Metabacillus fastidiosus]|uniref:TlpA family protein disulfide reductase n=1 Tax=Metabacillus fastidiosus TaxID=1458 RepID=UPI002DB60E95|nr:TlpA disulfide reductase family protein [Metabacillus fastidiosus]MEC2078563.1 TlpA disulfide reductase family protein [Metabacillus fastidiosus]